MIADIRKLLAPLHRKVSMSIGRGLVNLINDATGLQTVQISLLADETLDDVERFQNYGFASAPLPGAEGVLASVGGTRTSGVIVAVDDRRYRLRGLAGGEVGIYDDQGQTILLKRAGIEVATTKYVKVTAPKVTVICDDVQLGAEGGAKVARVGDSVVAGVITTGSNKVKAA